MRVQLQIVAKLFLFLLLISSLQELEASIACKSYFERPDFVILLDEMNIKYSLETEYGEPVALILPDIQSFLGRKALEFMQWPEPVYIKVDSHTPIETASHASYTSRPIYPIGMSHMSRDHIIYLNPKTLQERIGLESTLYHEGLHAHLRIQARKQKVHPMSTMFIAAKFIFKRQASPSSLLQNRTVLYGEEIYVHAEQLVFDANRILEKEDFSLLNKSLQDLSNPVAQRNDLAALLYSSARIGYGYVQSVQKLMPYVRQAHQAKRVQFYNEEGNIWAEFRLRIKTGFWKLRTEEILFYLPLQIKSEEATLEKCEKILAPILNLFESLLNEYSALFTHTYNFIYLSVHNEDFKQVEVYKAFLKSLKVPDPIEVRNRKPISQKFF